MEVHRESIKTMLEAARRYADEGRDDRAMEELRSAVAREPRNDQAHMLLGLAYQKRSDYASALRELNIARELNPANNEIFLLIGNVYSCQGQHEPAERNYREAVCRNAGNKKDAHYELGKVAEMRRNYRTAAEEYEKAVQEKGDNELALRIIHLYKLAGDRVKVEAIARTRLDALGAQDVFYRNIFLNELEIAQGKLVLTSKPRSMMVTLTNFCNLDCIMCEAKNIPWDIPRDILDEVIDHFPYLEHVMWQGGEVFLLDQFMDIFRESKKYPRMRQIIITNGMALNETIIEDLATHPNLTLSISMDSARKDLLERIRKGLKMEKLVENIELLNRMRKKNNSKMKLNINVTVMRSNYRHLMEIVEFAGKHHFDYVFLTTVYGNVGNDENIFLRKDAAALSYLEDTIGAIEDKARECGVILHNWLPIKRKDVMPAPEARGVREEGPAEKKSAGLLCYAPWQRLYIDWLGNMFPDCMCLPDKAAGNVRDYTIEAFWNSEGMQSYRQKMRDGRYHDLCRPYCIAGRIEHLI
jgi:MoaA/NifB/PqqE/SkfB family radical SAM enzyme/Tfp pilus assembly protein PilF